MPGTGMSCMPGRSSPAPGAWLRQGRLFEPAGPLHPDINYLGIDITDKVLILAKRKVEAAYAAAQLPPDNVKIASLDIESGFPACSARRIPAA